MTFAARTSHPDWGLVRSLVLASLLCTLALLGLAPVRAVAATFTVNTTGDTPDVAPGDGTCKDASSNCTLRAAIQEANALAGADTVKFNIAPAGTHTIAPASALDTITQTVTIDGATQPGFAGTPIIVLNGGGAGFGSGLVINAASCLIKGLVIQGFSSNSGIIISGAATVGNKVQLCYLGTNLAGNAAVPNFTGVSIFSSAHANTIGGTTTSTRNLISGNTGDGVDITGNGANSNVVAGNYIGTTAAGTVALPNGFNGVEIFGGAASNIIGGATVAPGTAPGNLISGNGRDGVLIQGDVEGGLPNGNKVQGNIIGTTAAGNATLPNSSNGVEITRGAMLNTVGGTAANLRNLISANGSDGVDITDSNTTRNLVQGNYIGTNAAGTAKLPNISGVVILGGAHANTIGGATATPGTAPGNLISGNNSRGVLINDPNSDHNLVQGNCIGTNAAGTAKIPNFLGVHIALGPKSNTIGGAVTASANPRNLISGNTDNGVRMEGSSTSLNLVQGNYIGTNAAGTGGLGNGNSGVALVALAAPNTVGGIVTGSSNPRNVISANAADGVEITSNSNVVQGNYIGTNAAGNAALGNVSFGVEVAGGDTNVLGSPTTGGGNVISANGLDGVLVNAGTGNRVEGNFIGTNAAGTVGLGNGGNGVNLINAALTNRIGGTVNPATGANPRNVISANTLDGVAIVGQGTNSNSVQGNYIGTNAAGNAALGNGLAGVEIVSGAQSNIVGTGTTGNGNVISSNNDDGVRIADAGTSKNLVQGNFIGTNAAGTGALGNGFCGVEIAVSATGNSVGTTAAGAGNVISANRTDGVLLTDAGTTGNSVLQNRIGTNAAGTAALTNLSSGVEIAAGAQSNAVGGASAPSRNVISGNTKQGVLLIGVGTNSNKVLGNFIGVNATNTGAIANGVGVRIDYRAQLNVIGTIAAGNGNVIATNTGDGVLVFGSATRNPIRGNSILSNGLRGINLQPVGEGNGVVTPNDPCDGDASPNNLQNFPTLTSATSNGATTTVGGTLDSVASTNFVLDFYRNASADPSGNGEGATYLGSLNVTTNSLCTASFSVTFSTAVPAGQFVSATATRISTSDTSEFSNAKTVVTGAASIAASAEAPSE